MTALLFVALAYLCGSIPTGVWLSRRHGVDPRDIGSGNIGATNVARAAGVSTGLLTLVGDVLKGLVPVVIARRVGYGDTVAALAGMAAFTGHLYSCFLGFDGGKGVATALGIFLGLAPLAQLVVLPVFAVTLAISRYVSLASLVAATVTPPLLIAFGYAPPIVAAGLASSALIAFRHRDNIRRLRFGTEAQVGRPKSSPAESGLA